jgi:trimethylamine:corrinoid methyltransferase-like protein
MVAGMDCDILGGAGQLEVATTASPVALLVDEELGRLLRRLGAGPGLDDETLAWQELLAAEPGTQFLTALHTYRHCREAYRSDLLTRQGREAWERAGARDLLARAHARVRALGAAPPAPPLAAEAVRALDAIVRTADATLCD